jgi:gag-polypeptide of LTR copia-type
MKRTSNATWGANKQVKSMKIPMARAQSNITQSTSSIIMSIPASAAAILSQVPMLDGSNWFTFEKRIKMYSVGCGAPEIHSGTPPTNTTAKAKFDTLDSILVAYLSTVVSDEYQYLVEDEDTTSAAFKRLKAHFQKPTVGHHMAAQQEFYDVAHDPNQPIAQYVQAVKAASARLSAYGVTVGDEELVDVLLMNLHESFHPICASILMAKPDPSSTDVINSLTGSAAASELISIKVEDAPPVLASRVSHGYGGGRGGRSGRSEWPSSGQDMPVGRVDKDGISWCDTTVPGACHRCGHSGHIAACCMFTMPQHVKDWIMHSRSRARSPSPPSPVHRARHAVADGYPYIRKQSIFSGMH